MAAKEVRFGGDARARMIRGVDILGVLEGRKASKK